MHPVDTVKTVQQASGLSIKQAIASVAKSGKGVGAFYEGIVPYAIADGLSGAVKFAAYEKSKIWCTEHLSDDWIPASRFACAALAFVCCSVILVPGELLKQRLQAGMYPGGLLQGIRLIATQEGPRAFFTGYSATLFRDVPYTMLELGLYDLLKSAAVKARIRFSGGGSSQKGSSRAFDELLAAAATGGLVGFATNPLDVVKTRMMTSTAGVLRGPLNAGKILLRDAGPKAFLTGATARVAWLMPFTTIYFGCYELTKRTLDSIKQQQKIIGVAA